jgi:hypothetical protein
MRTTSRKPSSPCLAASYLRQYRQDPDSLASLLLNFRRTPTCSFEEYYLSVFTFLLVSLSSSVCSVKYNNDALASMLKRGLENDDRFSGIIQVYVATSERPCLY